MDPAHLWADKCEEASHQQNLAEITSSIQILFFPHVYNFQEFLSPHQHILESHSDSWENLIIVMLKNMRKFNWLNMRIQLQRLKLDIFKPTSGILSTYNSKYVHFKYKRGYFSCEIINPTTVHTLEHWYLFCSWRRLMALPLNFPCPLTQLGSHWRISLHMRIHILLFPEGFVFCLKYKVTASLTAQAVSVGGVVDTDSYV